MANFCDVVKLDEIILPEEAVNFLVEYHKSTKEIILKLFFNLGKYLDMTSSIKFREGVNNGNPCITMVGLNEKNSQIWYSLLDKYTGQPQNFCG